MNRFLPNLNKFFPLKYKNYILILRKFYALYGFLFLVYAVIQIVLGAPLFAILLKLVLGILLLIYSFFIKKNLKIEVILTTLVSIDICFYALISYNAFQSSLFWLLLSPNFFFLFKNKKTTIFFVITLVVLVLITPNFSHYISLDYRTKITPAVQNGLTIINFLSILLVNFMFISRYIEINEKDRNSLIKRNLEIKKTKQKLIESQKIKDDIFLMLSHEIRTPLNGILGISALLENENIDEKLKNSLKQSSVSLLTLIEDFMYYENVNSEELPIQKREFSLSMLVENIFKYLNEEYQQKNVFYSYAIDPNIPDLLYNDQDKIHQLILNILHQVKRIAQKAEVVLHITCTSHSQELLLIFDINAKILEKQKTDLTNKPNSFKNYDIFKNARGELSFNASKKIVDILKGKISVNNPTQHEVQFHLELPFTPISENMQNNSSSTIGVFNNPNLKILLVDDYAINLTIATKQLTLNNSHVKVVGVDNGFDAIKLADEQSFDVILIDIRMPEISGIETSERIKKNSKFNIHTPIIAITADVSPQTYEECKNAGINKIISKPFNINELIAVINDLEKKPNETL